MSAIWGIIDLYGNPVDPYLGEVMKECYNTYCLEKVTIFCEEEILLGFGAQYFTVDSVKDHYPVVHKKRGIYFVADAVIDNRDELQQKVNTSDLADSELLCQVLEQGEVTSVNMIYGTYAMVSYNKSKQEVVLIADHLASRCLYYTVHKGRLIFSTVMKAIVTVMEGQAEINERWVSDYLGVDFLGIFTEPKQTYYEGIYKIEPGKVLTISKEGIVEQQYWNPLKTLRIDYRKSQEEYRNRFVDEYQKAVESQLNAKGETGILLSSGLDSSSVACIAAPILKQRGAVLHSFTSIPRKDYVPSREKHRIVNEEELVEQLKEYLGNLETNYLDIAEVNCWDGAIELMMQLEIPFKSLHNIRWMLACMETAKKQGCSIILTGQHGNNSVSLGEVDVYFNTLILKGKFFKIAKEVNVYGRRYGCSRKKLLKWIAYNATNGLKWNRRKEASFEGIYLNQGKIEEYHLKERFTKQGINYEKCEFLTIKKLHQYLLNNNLFSQMGECETKLSLITGVLMRDPTRDVRLIELVLQLPEHQFVHNGISRRLIREYLRGRIPDVILDQEGGKAEQSADMFYRLQPLWPRIYGEIQELLTLKEAEYWIDLELYQGKIHQLKDNFPKEYDYEVMKLLYSILMVKYLHELTR